VVATAIRQPTTTRCTIALALALLAGGLSVLAAWAQVPSVCPAVSVGHGPEGNTATSLGVAEQLEQALNSEDSAAALAIFADDAVAASSSSKRWQGTSGLRDFLVQLRNPTAALDPGPIDTRVRCAAGERVVWLFSYPSSAGTGSADLFVQDGRITHILWTFNAPTPGKNEDSVPAAPMSSPEQPGAPVTPAAFFAVLGVATLGGLLVCRRRPLANTGDVQHGLLDALASGSRRRSAYKRRRARRGQAP